MMNYCLRTGITKNQETGVFHRMVSLNLRINVTEINVSILLANTKREILYISNNEVRKTWNEKTKENPEEKGKQTFCC